MLLAPFPPRTPFNLSMRAGFGINNPCHSMQGCCSKNLLHPQTYHALRISSSHVDRSITDGLGNSMRPSEQCMQRSVMILVGFTSSMQRWGFYLAQCSMVHRSRPVGVCRPDGKKKREVGKRKGKRETKCIVVTAPARLPGK